MKIYDKIIFVLGILFNLIPLRYLYKWVELYDDFYYTMRGVAEDDYDNAVDSVDCMGGSDIGCCGNYSGCCWFANIGCAAHDLICWECEPRWFCLDGCKPE
ncbi:MAG: hypothetical protein H6587_03160 [Flavobacteriales bacterium]|nr:hypothetical protein [Flavobacteriales bacterium]MCB9363547.1 hypothetical protein [Flavobacteriales bacterium]